MFLCSLLTTTIINCNQSTLGSIHYCNFRSLIGPDLLSARSSLTSVCTSDCYGCCRALLVLLLQLYLTSKHVRLQIQPAQPPSSTAAWALTPSRDVQGSNTLHYTGTKELQKWHAKFSRSNQAVTSVLKFPGWFYRQQLFAARRHSSLIRKRKWK